MQNVQTVYLGFHFGGGGGGGGGSKYFRKVGIFVWVKGGSGAFSPENSFFKCAFWRKFCPKENATIFIFHIKIIDNVLLRTIFKGIGAYSPDFLSIVQFSVFWRTFSVNFLLRINNIDMVLLRTSYRYGSFLEFYFKLQFSAFGSIHGKTLS